VRRNTLCQKGTAPTILSELAAKSYCRCDSRGEIIGFASVNHPFRREDAALAASTTRWAIAALPNRKYTSLHIESQAEPTSEAEDMPSGK
jgi:hypothetical protein